MNRRGIFGFEVKMYYYPIPNAEMLKENKLVQNTGW